MSIVVKVHPLGELLSKYLFSIENVPREEQTRMVRRAIKAACKYHDAEIENTVNEVRRVSHDRS